MKIALRPISEADFKFIYEVTKVTMQTYVEQTWGSWVDEEQWTRTYNSINLLTHQIIQLNSQDIGCLAVERSPSHIQLTKFYILPHFQRRGIGSFLIKQLINEARTRQIPLRLRVLAVNPAINLYKREGFVVQTQTKERIYMEYAEFN